MLFLGTRITRSKRSEASCQHDNERLLTFIENTLWSYLHKIKLIEIKKFNKMGLKVNLKELKSKLKQTLRRAL